MHTRRHECPYQHQCDKPNERETPDKKITEKFGGLKDLSCLCHTERIPYVLPCSVSALCLIDKQKRYVLSCKLKT